MKQNVKIFFIALALGAIASYFVCYKFDSPLTALGLESKATMIYIGSYNNVKEANNKLKSYPNAIIYEENQIYKVVIGIFQDKECLTLMKSYFNDANLNYETEEIKVNPEFVKAIKNYELLVKTSEKEYYSNINKSILKVFNEYTRS